METGSTPTTLGTPRQLYAIAHLVMGLLLTLTQVFLVPVLVQMVLYTGSILYIGSHHSLTTILDSESTTGRSVKVETVSKRDAMLFPVIGSVVLFSMYLAYKVFGAFLVNLLMTTYLTCAGLVALAETLRGMLAPFCPEGWCTRSTELEFKVPLLLFGLPDDEPVKLTVSKVRVIAYLLSAGFSVTYLATKHWAIHNLFAISFALQAISMISLGKFVVAFILLSGLFIYDIFWVFGTEVMVSVATQFQGPIKIIFPVSFDPWKQSILGLGDIVIPGVLVAMCLRFDAYLHWPEDAGVLNHYTCFSKPYFWTVWAAYLASLLLTGVIMFWFKSPQPALLYLVPGTCLTLAGSSFLRGHFSEMLAYDENGQEEADETDEQDSGKKDQ